jgi:hypothetical protein
VILAANTSGWLCVPAAGEAGGDVHVLRLSPHVNSVVPLVWVVAMYSPML